MFKLKQGDAEKTVAVFSEYFDAAHAQGALFDRKIIDSLRTDSLPSEPYKDIKAWYIDLNEGQAAATQAAGVKIPDGIETVDSMAAIRESVNKKAGRSR